jgi:hypothetical protein
VDQQKTQKPLAAAKTNTRSRQKATCIRMSELLICERARFIHANFLLFAHISLTPSHPRIKHKKRRRTKEFIAVEAHAQYLLESSCFCAPQQQQ